jgi:hypothetical protein
VAHLRKEVALGATRGLSRVFRPIQLVDEAFHRLVVERKAFDSREPVDANGFADRSHEHARNDGLAEVAHDAMLDGLRGGIQLRVAGREHDGDVESTRAHRCEQVDSAHAWQRDVAQDHVERRFSERQKGGFRIGGRFDLVPLLGQTPHVETQHRGLVVDDERAGGAISRLGTFRIATTRSHRASCGNRGLVVRGFSSRTSRTFLAREAGVMGF